MSNENFITGLYQLALARSPSQSELNQYAIAINYIGPREVARQINESVEARGIKTTEFFNDYLDRDPSSPEKTSYYNLYGTEEDVQKEILNSAEFDTLAQTEILTGTHTERTIKYLYQVLLLRVPLAAELAYQLGTNGIDDVIVGILQSYEYRFRVIHGLYNTIFGSEDLHIINDLAKAAIDIFSVKLRFESSQQYYGSAYCSLSYKNIGILLPSPLFGNSDKLEYTRINRSSRGNDLIIYRDGRWPKSENMSFEWDNLKELIANQVMSFLKESLGQIVKITDHEGREFDAIVLSPQGEKRENTKGHFGVRFNVEVIR